MLRRNPEKCTMPAHGILVGARILELCALVEACSPVAGVAFAFD